MKMIMVTNQDFNKALTNLSKQSIPIKTGFKLKTILKKVNEEYQKYEECRKEALDRFAEKNENGAVLIDEKGNIKLTEESKIAFFKEMEDLLNMEMELPTISISELGDKVNLTAQELFLLEGLVVE